MAFKLCAKNTLILLGTFTAGAAVAYLHTNNANSANNVTTNKIWAAAKQPFNTTAPVIETKKVQQTDDSKCNRINDIGDANGDKYWRQNGELHRIDGPAIECGNGDKYWYQNNKLQRVDGPAVEKINGEKHWYQNNILHRVGGPAVEGDRGSKYWYQHGKLHRTDGPAIEWSDGSKCWYLNGKPQRSEYADGLKLWYINKKPVSEAEYIYAQNSE